MTLQIMPLMDGRYLVAPAKGAPKVFKTKAEATNFVDSLTSTEVGKKIKVQDALEKVTLTITPQDVRFAKSKDPTCCAAARAARRLNGVSGVRIHLGRIFLKKGERWIRYKTPRSLRDEIISFDRGGGFAPGTYTLSPVQASGKLTGKATGGKWKAKSRGKGKKRSKPHFVEGVRVRAAGI